MKQYKQQIVLKRVKSNFKFFIYNSTNILKYNKTESKTKHIHQKKDEEMQWEKTDSAYPLNQLKIKSNSDLVSTQG